MNIFSTIYVQVEFYDVVNCVVGIFTFKKKLQVKPQPVLKGFNKQYLLLNNLSIILNIF